MRKELTVFFIFVITALAILIGLFENLLNGPVILIASMIAVVQLVSIVGWMRRINR